MKKAVVPFLCLVLGCGPEKSIERTGEVDSSIVNGSSYSGHPAAVYVDLGGGSCTGTLISPSIVLTAKHCTEGVSYKSIEVMFGNDAYGSGTWIKAVHYENNPKGYSGGPGDLALITLASPGPTDPIPVNTTNPNSLIGIDVHIVGFGVTGEYKSDSGKKRHGWTSLLEVEPGLVYTSVKPSSTCYGDSGGPNFITLSGKEYVLAATSFGTAACGSGLDASARTDDSITWIEKYVATHEKFAGTCELDGKCVSGCLAPDLDCPCAADGFCTAECSDLSQDVDCEGCLDDGVCREDCPSLDKDCCSADGSCNKKCGTLDVDCAPPQAQPPAPVEEDPSVIEEGDGKSGPPTTKDEEQKPLLWVGCSTIPNFSSRINHSIVMLFIGTIIARRKNLFFRR